MYECEYMCIMNDSNMTEIVWGQEIVNLSLC